MDMKIDTCRKKFRSCPQDPPREALGRVLGGFGEVWGRLWEDFKDDGKRVGAPTVAIRSCLSFASCKVGGSEGGNGRRGRRILA